ncbi:hypothetical protein [Burkholderia cenocepacia]|uniref:hypothetical protein n=1 Tax=Burkholderia cenocepacia TaxID=95486 RepID=UPI000761FE4E|nr:hypothetical protein [Burkholderia cenocepacia]
MKADVLGQMERDGKRMYVAEASGNLIEDSETFLVTLGINGNEVPLDLAAIRQVKRMLHEGEKRLMIRHEQATRRRNYSLDL